jgi:vancomycin resistance protein YoaR
MTTDMPDSHDSTDPLEAGGPGQPSGGFESIAGADSGAPAWRSEDVDSFAIAAPEPVQAASSPELVETTRPLKPIRSFVPVEAGESRAAALLAGRPGLRRAGFALAFLVGSVAALFLVAAVTFGVSQAYGGRILPGVHVGSVDLSGLTRAEAIDRLSDAYGNLDEGKVTIVTPSGTGTITYQQIGRRADIEGMADAALGVGRSGDPLSNAVGVARSLAGGEDVPLMIKLDTTALSRRLRAVTAVSLVPPVEPKVTYTGTVFTVVPGSPGSGIDEVGIAGTIIDQLTQDGAPSELRIESELLTLQPRFTDEQAQAAAAMAPKMVVDVTLIRGSQTWTIEADKIRSWIIFGKRSDGTFGPVVDPVPVKAELTELAKLIDVAPINPTFITDRTGKPIGVSEGKDGLALDVDATALAIEAYLDGLPAGGDPSQTILLVVNDITPKLTDEQAAAALTKMKIIGSWTTIFYPGETNGYGTNIRLPAALLNGVVVAPGAVFSFFDAVSPIDYAHGYKDGGVISGGKSDHTGAVGGGICSVSTTMFNAAMWAGLPILERHPHYYYIDRYPIGLDATVYSNGYSVTDLRWKNDTAYPIVIVGKTSGSSTSRITFELWSVPTGRTVTTSTPVVTNRVAAGDSKEYMPSWPVGRTYRKEYPTPGFNAYVTRTVKDSTGKVLYYDQWYSHYSVVKGILQVGGPGPTPKPSPGTPPPVITPEPTAAPRRRKLR